MGIFAQHAPGYLEAGIPCFPVDTRTKKPRVRNWQRAGRNATSAFIDKFGDADGIGICVGEKTRIVEVDVDIAGDAPLAAAIERFGETPLSIRTASGKSKLWYRHHGEGRCIRVPGDLPIDVLGDGFTIAPPSRREDLGTSYQFLTGGLSDVRDLPGIRADALYRSDEQRIAETVATGTRNNSLFLYCMTEARHYGDVEALIHAAQDWNSALPQPLGLREAERTARSAWRYETTGRNFVGVKRPQFNLGDKVMDDLMDEPDAFVLLGMFERYHGNRESFAIAPRAMSEAGYPPWRYSRIDRARDVLVTRGFLQVIRHPSRGTRKAGLYRLNSKMINYVNNHCTPLSPLSPLGRAA